MKRLFLILAILALATPASAADVTLQWDAPDDPRVTGYTVYHGTDNPPAMPIPTTETSLRITGLIEGTVYYFGVKSTDGTRESETDTGSTRIRPVTKDWADERRSWSDMYWAYRYDYACGFLDLPSHIIYQPAGKLSGMPLPPGAPVSFGHSGDLLDVVNYWLGHPEHNFGIMLKADPLYSLSGDQTVMFRPQARLRLTLDTP